MSLQLKSVLLVSVIVVATSFAADIPDSGRLLRESTPPPTMRQQQLPMIEAPQQRKEVVPDGVKVKVSAFAFKGNTVFSSDKLSAVLAVYIGKELTFAELNAAAAEITALYRANGYFLASAIIPPQTIRVEAPILIEIVEGILEGVRLETRPAETRVPRTLLQRFTDLAPINKPADEVVLSNMVMRINEIPGISSRILLEPGTLSGTVKGLLEVTEGKPFNISVDTDNHGSFSTGYYRIGSTLELYSPLRLGDLFSLRVQTSFSGESQAVQSGYILPISGNGTRIGVNYSFVTYRLGRDFVPLDASGDAHDFTITITQPLIRSRNMILNLAVAGEGKILDDRTGSIGLQNKRHTTTGQVGISGVQMDTFLSGGATSFFLNYTGGFLNIDDEMVLTNDQSVTGLSTNGSYNKLAMSLFRNQTIYKNLTFYTGVTGQWASTNLDSSEQLSLGGPSGVRAFPVSEASGDMGFVYTAELRYLISSLGDLPGSLQFAAIVDHGYVVLHDAPLDPENNTRNLTGVGFGLTWFDSDSFNLRTSIAWRTAGSAIGQTEITQPTVYFQAVKRL